jgi:hypothetical protein
MCSSVKIRDGNLINSRDGIERLSFTGNYNIPSVISSHLYTSSPFVDLVKGGTRETLIMYIHREELSIVRSAAQHVLTSHICTNHGRKKEMKLKQKYNVTHTL